MSDTGVITSYNVGFSIVVSYVEQYIHLGNCMFNVITSARGIAYPLQQLHPVHVHVLHTTAAPPCARTYTLQQLHPVHVRRLITATCKGTDQQLMESKRESKDQARTKLARSKQ